jgi:hypothetical protein
MRAILLDAKTRTVKEVDYNNDWKTISPTIGCDVFTVVRLGNGDDLYVDDEGLLKVDANTVFIKVPWYPTPLAGSGLIMSCDQMGSSRASKHDADYYRSQVRFVSSQAVWLEQSLKGGEL